MNDTNLCSTFGSYYGLSLNEFYGNVGKSLDGCFLRHLEAFRLPSLLADEKPNDENSKNLHYLNLHQELNLNHFQMEKQKLISKYDDLIEATRWKDSQTRHFLLKELFKKINKDLEGLQKQYDIQLQYIVESHTNTNNKFFNVVYDV